MKELASIPLPALQPSLGTAKEPQIDWVRASDGAQLACRIWQGKPGQAVICYLHGIEGHSQWFEQTASFLNSRGLTIYAPDRRGAGLNTRDRGHLRSYKVFLADTEIMLRHLAQQYPGHPLILFGNCWGAKAAALIAASGYRGVDGPMNVKLSGLVLTSPALFTRVDFDLKTKMRIGADVMRRDRFEMRQIPIPIALSMFTDNAQFRQYIQNDPLRLKEATSRFYFENLILSLRAIGASKRIQVPLLLVQSGSDEIVDIAKVEAWFAQVPAKDKSLRLFPEAAHSIDFDPVWFRDYTNLLDDWIQARTVA